LAARLGIGARGVIYVVFAYLAFDVARHGSAPAQADSTGALAEVGRRAGGTPILVVLAVGLACYAGWRLFDGLSGGHAVLRRLGSIAIAVIYIGLLVRALELAAGHPTSGGASANPTPDVSRVLRWNHGAEIVGAAGAVLVIAGVGLALWGIFHRYSKNLDLERLSLPRQRVIRLLGALGNFARGFLLVLVGGFLLKTAVTSDPNQAKGVDQALQALVHHSYGAILIAGVALGLFCFGLFSFAEARLRRFHSGSTRGRMS
jgi:hypothetical protein